jgi:hypothetical protein
MIKLASLFSLLPLFDKTRKHRTLHKKNKRKHNKKTRRNRRKQRGG